MDKFTLYQLINNSTASSGGTSDGLSRDIKATECGLYAALAEALPPHTFSVPQQFFSENGKPRVIGNRAGSVFHALNEMRANPAELPDDCAEDDAAAAAAIYAYKRYIEQCGGLKTAFSRRISPEFPIAGYVGGHARTGRLDDVIDADEDEIDRWADWGIFVAEPGIYPLDYKLLASVSDKDAQAKSRSMQALAYMWMYENTTGIRPKGFIHDLVSRAANPKVSRRLVLTPNSDEGRGIVSDFVQLAARRREEGQADASKCDNQYGPCRFIKICPRRGNRLTNAQLLADQVLLSGASAEVSEDE